MEFIDYGIEFSFIPLQFLIIIAYSGVFNFFQLTGDMRSETLFM